MAKISLDENQVARLKNMAADISNNISNFVEKHSTTSVERTVLRLYGVDGVNKDQIPLCNVLIDNLKKKNNLSDGVSKHFAAAMLESQRDPQTTATLIDQGQIDFGNNINKFSYSDIIEKENELAKSAVKILDDTRLRKKAKQEKNSIPKQPWRYIIVATGNIYEDRIQAKSAVSAGADIVAVIRSTAQSLLDYVPYGPTTEGFGGTFATQENFKIMRKALDETQDEAQNDAKRYVRLVNYASGLCMAEISACAAFEDLDMLLNDSMYGILFRDINMKRTFIDQYFSRLICARSKIIINTGEDNYLTTSDAIDNAHTVIASQLINEAMAKKALLTEDLMGLGHAFEINPKIKNALLYEIAHAQLVRQLFPNAPLKYMPPTKYKSTDIFYSHCMDTMFNFTSMFTKQGIHLTGILTEAIHTPLMQDRYESLSNVNYVFNIANDFSDEIEFKKDGFIVKRAQKVLDETEAFLKDIIKLGLMDAIANKKFADIARLPDNGKGADGVFEKSSDYSNPIGQIIEEQGVIYG